MSATIYPFRRPEGLADDVSEAKSRVTKLRADLIDAKRGERLVSPGCKTGCAICYRKCAVTKIMLDWWERELKYLTGSPSGMVH